MVLRIFLRVIAQSLQSNSPGALIVDKAAPDYCGDPAHQLVTGKTGDFESLWGKPGHGGRGAAQITLLNTKPLVVNLPGGAANLDGFTRIESAFKMRCLAPHHWNTCPFRAL